MHLVINDARCSGCRACEVSCVVHHDGRFGTATARIRVEKIEARGVDRPRVCRQCEDAPCVAACPAGALVRDAATSAVRLLPDDCIVCSACSDACEFGAVLLHPSTSMPLICDLCDGEPACVGRCATGALACPGLTAGAYDSSRSARSATGDGR